MFDNRLNWNGYNPELLSPGGAVFERSAKTHHHLRRGRSSCFDLPKKVVTPGGADARHPAGPRRPALARRHRHVREGAARKTTPPRATAPTTPSASTATSCACAWSARARTSASRSAAASSTRWPAASINTDAIDNSAGVDTSDHEVNIKILLYDAIARGELAGIEERNRILAEMTDDVGQLVLRDNYEQTQAISITHALGEALLDAQARFMRGAGEGRQARSRHRRPARRRDHRRAARAATSASRVPRSPSSSPTRRSCSTKTCSQSDLPDDPQLVDDLRALLPRASCASASAPPSTAIACAARSSPRWSRTP